MREWEKSRERLPIPRRPKNDPYSKKDKETDESKEKSTPREDKNDPMNSSDDSRLPASYGGKKSITDYNDTSGINETLSSSENFNSSRDEISTPQKEEKAKKRESKEKEEVTNKESCLFYYSNYFHL